MLSMFINDSHLYLYWRVNESIYWWGKIGLLISNNEFMENYHQQKILI